jgi:hypothetical protein
MTLLTLPT